MLWKNQNISENIFTYSALACFNLRSVCWFSSASPVCGLMFPDSSAELPLKREPRAAAAHVHSTPTTPLHTHPHTVHFHSKPAGVMMHKKGKIVPFILFSCSQNYSYFLWKTRLSLFQNLIYIKCYNYLNLIFISIIKLWPEKKTHISCLHCFLFVLSLMTHNRINIHSLFYMQFKFGS